jgi:predicted ArsR family transcriptional regulator
VKSVGGLGTRAGRSSVRSAAPVADPTHGPAAAPPDGLVGGAATVAHDDPSTRTRLVRSLLQDGPSTNAALAERLGVTTAAVRRHLDVLVEHGDVESSERRPYGPEGPRGRGRPARVFALTAQGRSGFGHAYDSLAADALRHMETQLGPQVITEFARARAQQLVDGYRAGVDAAAPAQRVTALAEAMTADGYAASASPAPSGHGEQICQHHCPVAAVARQFPQLCEAETEAIAALLGTHVQRLATIGQGDHVCTTYVPNVGAGLTSTSGASRTTGASSLTVPGTTTAAGNEGTRP